MNADGSEGTGWLPWLGLAIEMFGKLDWINVLLVATGFGVLVFLLIAQMRPGDGFDIRALVATRSTAVNGREYWTVTAKAYQFGGFLVTTWGFINLIGKGALSDLYLMIYSVAWLASPAINQIVNSKFPVAPGTTIEPPEEPPSSSVTTTTTTQVKP